MIKKSPTILGYIALLLWSTMALVTTKIVHLPIFEVLSIVFLSSFLLHSARLTFQKKWHLIRQPLSQWICGILGVGLQQVTYIFAFKFAPAAEVDLIIYLWPIFVTLLARFTLKEAFRRRYLLGAFLGFLGIFTLNQGHTLREFSTDVLIGFSCAFLCSLFWSFYSVTSRRTPHVPSEIIGLYLGLSLVVTVPLHLMTETFVFPTLKETFLLFYMGLFSAGFAYFLWDHGMKRGNIFILSVLSYMNPIVSISLLILAGAAKGSHVLGIASFFVALGGMVGGIPWTTVRRYLESKALSFCQIQACFIK